ncbi:MAG: radical SAM/SPASM domain-containing protein [Acidobacteriota bacterium]
MLFATGLQAKPPKYISFEPSSKCNLHCVMCSRETLAQKPLNINMSLDAFRHMLDQFTAPADVTLCGIGEPLLNPQIIQMVQYVTERQMRPTMITNGTIMRDETAHKLIDAGLKKITFSIHGGTADTHQLIRQGPKNVDSLERVYGNIQRFVEIRNERKAEVIVIANYLAARQTVAEFPSTLRKAKEIGIDEVVALRLINVNGALDHLAPEHGQERQIVGYRKLAAEIGVKFSFWEGTGMCRELWECIFIMSNGDIGPCDGWLYDKPPMGNLLEEHAEDVWNGPKYQELRKTFLAKKLDWCDTCCLGGAFESPLQIVVDKVRRRAGALVQLTR